jgi:hypothetical protein
MHVTPKLAMSRGFSPKAISFAPTISSFCPPFGKSSQTDWRTDWTTFGLYMNNNFQGRHCSLLQSIKMALGAHTVLDIQDCSRVKEKQYETYNHELSDFSDWPCRQKYTLTFIVHRVKKANNSKYKNVGLYETRSCLQKENFLCQSLMPSVHVMR